MIVFSVCLIWSGLIFDVRVVKEFPREIKWPPKINVYFWMLSLVGHAGKFSMLHSCMHCKFLKNIENTGSMHGKIL